MTCSVEGCDRPKLARGWCTTHYQRWQKTGRLDLRTPIERLLQRRVITPDRCWLPDGRRAKPHSRAYLRVDGQIQLAARVAYEAFRGPIPEGIYVCHTCDEGNCFNPEHLFLGTHSDNMRDAFAKGRGRVPRVTGERHHLSRLTDAQVATIRSDPRSNLAVARDYGVADSTVSRIRRRRTWAHVP